MKSSSEEETNDIFGMLLAINDLGEDLSGQLFATKRCTADLTLQPKGGAVVARALL